MENQRIMKNVNSLSSLNSKQSTKFIQQPNALIQQQPTQIVKKQNIPPIPLKQVSNLLPIRETPIFKQTQDERYSYTKDATCLMAKLDSLREIKSADSPIRSHVSPIPSTLQSIVVLTQNNATKPQLLQQVPSSSCVEPFKIQNNRVNISIILLLNIQFYNQILQFNQNKIVKIYLIEKKYENKNSKQQQQECQPKLTIKLNTSSKKEL